MPNSYMPNNSKQLISKTLFNSKNYVDNLEKGLEQVYEKKEKNYQIKIFTLSNCHHL